MINWFSAIKPNALESLYLSILYMPFSKYPVTKFGVQQSSRFSLSSSSSKLNFLGGLKTHEWQSWEQNRIRKHLEKQIQNIYILLGL